jgi:hypothetical protein
VINSMFRESRAQVKPAMLIGEEKIRFASFSEHK